MAGEIKIGNTIIGREGNVFIIAEAGVNHEGNFKIAKEMVRVAAEAGANAVTFQHVVDSELNVKQKDSPKKLNWEKWFLKDEEIRELLSLAKERGLLCTACVIDNASVDMIVDYGADFFKIVSGDITNIPFLKYCAGKGLPLFISTGAASLEEVEAAVKAIKSEGNDKIVIYHTNTNYPTALQEINMRVLSTLQATFNEIIGFCDHTEGYLAPLIGTVLGAKVVEKHFTLDRSKKGPDYQVSLEPGELKEMISHIRNIELILGSPVKKILDSEQKTYKFARRSIVARQKIPKGVRITQDMLAFKRPGTGISPSLAGDIIAQEAARDICEDEIIEWGMIQKRGKE